MEERQREIQNILNSLPTQSVNAVNRLRQIGRPAVPALAVALRFHDPVVRRAAARALARINDPAAVPALAEAVDDPDSRARTAAILALADIPGQEAVRALAGALRARHALVRDVAARALARRSLGALRSALDDPDPVVRAAAAHGVGYYAGDRASVPRLVELLRDEVLDVRVMAVRALAWIGVHHSAALESLLEALRHPDEDVRATAAHYLGRMGDTRAAGALAAALCDDSRRVVLAAIRSLGAVDSEVPGAHSGVGDHRAVPGLLGHLSGGDADVRVAAANALAAILAADPQARALPSVGPALRQCLTDPDPRLRTAAATALGETGDAAAIEPLTHALSDPVWSVRASAASALGVLGGESAVAALEAARADTDIAVASRAEIALQHVRARLR